MIRQRLFDWYRINTTKNLGIKNICPRPFDTILIDNNGSCYVCECTSWLPQSIGNLRFNTIHELLNNNIHKELQNSVSDQSYRYCNNKQCSYLLDDRQHIKFSKNKPNKIEFIRLGIDNSCNLKCPSCRTKKYFLSDINKLNYKKNIANKIIDFISQNGRTHVHLGSDGDPFASLVYRYFLRKISSFDNVTMGIQTNGLLIKKMYQKNKKIFNQLTELNISIDGASQDTYEKLRLNGKWKNILENLKFVRDIKASHNFNVVFHFVIQRTNFHEMRDMIEMSEFYGADKVWLNKLTNWNTFENFLYHDVTDPENTRHGDYKKKLQEIKNILNTCKIKIEMPTLGHFK